MKQNLIHARMETPNDLAQRIVGLMERNIILSVVRVTPFREDMTPHPPASYLILIQKRGSDEQPGRH